MEVVVKAKESLLDYHMIYEICKDRLLASGVTIQLKTNFSEDMIASYDKVINCTYSEINALLHGKSEESISLKFAKRFVCKHQKISKVLV